MTERKNIAWIDNYTFYWGIRDPKIGFLEDELEVKIDIFENANNPNKNNFLTEGSHIKYDAMFLHPWIAGILPEGRRLKYREEVGFYLFTEIIKAEDSINKDTPIYVQPHLTEEDFSGEISRLKSMGIPSKQDWLNAGATDVYSIRKTMELGIEHFLEIFRKYIER